jgi:hypothetical protein
MKAIFHFENHERVATRYRVRFYEPKLASFNMLDETKISFQDYIDRSSPLVSIRNPFDVAKRAASEWDSMDPNPEKAVWVLDLDADGGDTTNSSYGLCVLIALTQQFGMSIEQFLENRSFLVVILTLYPEELLKDDGINLLLRPRCDLQALHEIWPKVKRIQNGTSYQNLPQAVENGLASAWEPGPKVIWANSSKDDAWMSELIVKWLE